MKLFQSDIPVLSVPSNKDGQGEDLLSHQSRRNAQANGVRLSDAPAGSCWLAIFGTVYDLTTFNHPGGPLKSCGTDATNSFSSITSPVPHNAALLSTLPASDTLGPLLVVSPSTPTGAPAAAPTKAPSNNSGSGGSGGSGQGNGGGGFLARLADFFKKLFLRG